MSPESQVSLVKLNILAGAVNQHTAVSQAVSALMLHWEEHEKLKKHVLIIQDSDGGSLRRKPGSGKKTNELFCALSRVITHPPGPAQLFFLTSQALIICNSEGTSLTLNQMEHVQVKCRGGLLFQVTSSFYSLPWKPTERQEDERYYYEYGTWLHRSPERFIVKEVVPMSQQAKNIYTLYSQLKKSGT